MAAQSSQDTAHKAGLFDIRSIIGLLLGIYGVILVITSFFTSDKQLAKADGVNVNLWAGLGLVVAALVFLAWVRLRPIVVPDDPEDGADGD
ncbi:hypothetical protein [Nocardioides marmoribigeumensis]|jgi:drug/metabolite transporter (DMT)-like permease|uniref:Drug/metabolite transporter (DMT)-like permease n=1 Tax=Nocardioides marmoribigeumensis TaxID=433649 RepID=A0ABU2BST5_9ACTN|nr:hypothetical protein [Nocardioides marmoribigeumensis]MDR7360793.1 drug/metabolite transporter (DMT)-like permease [Nocardioides marmoribigeumensis]